jgi:hypothetical protein
MVFASVGFVTVVARVPRITMSSFVVAFQVFRVPEARITFGTLVLVGFGFVMRDLVMAVVWSVLYERMCLCADQCAYVRADLVLQFLLQSLHVKVGRSATAVRTSVKSCR